MITDEVSYTRERVFNSRNNHIWAQEIPYAIIQCGHKEKFSANAWAGIVNDFLAGPYNLSNKINAQTHIVFQRSLSS